MGSTMSKMAAAEKLSIPQLQQAIKDGTVPSFIGIPLLDEKVKTEQRMKAASQMQQPEQPPIAQQIMQKAAQAELGVEQLPSGLPAQGYALGGIVAFAGGGEAEDTTYEDYQAAQELERDDEIMDRMLGRLDINATPPTGMGYGQVQGQRLRADKSSKEEPAKGYDASGHKYDSLATEYAKKIGLPEGLGRYMLHKETGGMKNPDAAVSSAGAYGPAQIMPATAKSRGIDYKNPEKNVMGGLDYLNELYNKYGKDERLALAAYNAGPGRVDRALKSGEGILSLKPETIKYVGMKEGGVAHFAAGSQDAIDSDIPVASTDLRSETPYSLYKPQDEWTIGERMKYGWSGEKPLSAEAKKYQKTEAPVATPAAPAAPSASAPSAPAPKPTSYTPPAPKAEPPVENKPTIEPAEAPESAYDKWMKRVYERDEARSKGADQDKWMGLMAAGLGMLGSQSQYANVGIGQGALQGLSFYQSLQKQRAAEESSDLKSMLTAQHYQQAEDIARERLEQQKGLTTTAQSDKVQGQREGSLQRFEQNYLANVKANANAILDPTEKETYVAKATRDMYANPQYKMLYQRAYPGEDVEKMFPSSGGVVMPQGVTVSKVK